MELVLRFLCAGALALTAVAVHAQNSPPPAPAPGRVVPSSPEAAPSTPLAARKVPSPAANPTTDELTTSARAQADAEHQAARARCEAHPTSEQAACLRAADEAYDRVLAGQNPDEQGNPGSNTGADETGRG